MRAEKKKITIEVLDAGSMERIRVLATVYGAWAFHPSYQGAGWQVTHVPSGKNLCALADHFAHNEVVMIVAQLGPLDLNLEIGPAGELGDDEAKYCIHAIVGAAIA